MFAKVQHTEGLAFETRIRNHVFFQDTSEAAGGTNRGPTPKELLLAGVIGCTGMDVVSILKKHSASPERLVITAEAEPRKEHPRVFSSTALLFDVAGEQLSADHLRDAVVQSLTKYCGVTAMISKVVPVSYRILLNGHEIHRGTADFGL